MDNSHDPLHGLKLETILVELEKKHGWKVMGETLNIKCFLKDARLKSSLKFLRQTPWARTKVEILYLKTFCKKHPATTKLIRNLVEQKKTNSTHLNEPKKASEDNFNWPSLN
ncbi:MAG TPA: DUF2132 domain-containing protein [Psychromonas hadalis]|nr:DUF2132 domain-containing protein [Psychromonas hadalis]